MDDADGFWGPGAGSAKYSGFFISSSKLITFLLLLCRVYIPCIYVLNKIDQISIEELDIIYKVPHCVPISAHHRWNFDDLLEKIWDYLKLVRMWVLMVTLGAP